MLKKALAAALAAIIFVSIFAFPANAAGIGVCTHMSTGREIEPTVKAADSVDAPWIRDEIKWNAVEKTIGVLEIPQYASWVDEAREKGMNTLCILCYGNPIYPAGKVTEDEVAAGGNIECALPARDGDPLTVEDDIYFDAYINYVDFVSKEMAGKIDAYEIWNEPDIKIFNAKDATASDYTALLKEAYKTIKKNDPDVIILGGVLAGNTAFLDEMLSVGAAEYMDALSYHYYLGTKTPESRAKSASDNIASVVKKHGLTELDLWLTETGWANSLVDEEQQAKYIVKNAVFYEDFLKDNNLEGQYFSYELHNSSAIGDVPGNTDYEGSLGLFYSDYSPKPSAKSVTVYNNAVNGKELASFREIQYGLGFKAAYNARFEAADGKTAYLLWSYGEKEVSIELSSGTAKAYDMSGKLICELTQPGNYTVVSSDSPIVIDCTSSDITAEFELNIIERIVDFVYSLWLKIEAAFK